MINGIEMFNEKLVRSAFSPLGVTRNGMGFEKMTSIRADSARYGAIVTS